MGVIYYGGMDTAIHIDDRALAHLKIVIATKLRRGESFTVSWKHPDDQPRGRTTLWFHPSIPLRFVFDEPEPPELSRQWIEELAASANSSGGISLVPEVIEPDPPADPPPLLAGAAAGRVEIGELAVGSVRIEGTELSAPDVGDSARLGTAREGVTA